MPYRKGVYWDFKKPPVGYTADLSHPLGPKIACFLMNDHGGFTITSRASTFTTCVSGPYNNARLPTETGHGVNFPSPGVYYHAPDVVPLRISSGNFTVVIKLQPRSLHDYGNLIAKMGAGYTAGWGIITFANGSWNFQKPGSSDVTGSAAGALVNGVWTQIAVAFDGSTYYPYTGLNAYTSAAGTNPTGGTADFIIGSDIVSNRPFDGIMDYFYIFDRCLSANEIRQLYFTPFVGIEKPRRRRIISQVSAAAPAETFGFYRRRVG